MSQFDEAAAYLAKAGDAVVNFGAYRAACAAALGNMECARHEYEPFENAYRRKIAFGRKPLPGEAVRWVVQVEPFRHIEHSHMMPDALRQSGIVEIDVKDALQSRPGKMVRPAEIPRQPWQVCRLFLTDLLTNESRHRGASVPGANSGAATFRSVEETTSTNGTSFVADLAS